MNYNEKLKEAADKSGSIICMGMDPVISEIPIEGKPGDVILKFYEDILERIAGAGVYPGAVKPNYAFYAQYGLEGIEALQKLIAVYKQANIPVILDAKRGDIGSTAAAYAREAYNFFNADAVTLSPYMGYDSVRPFAENYPDKGAYILTKTSNAGSGDIQDILCPTGEPLFMHTAGKIIGDWHFDGIGSVAGATWPKQLEAITGLFAESGKNVAMLIPGVGVQGGSIAEVLKALGKFPDIRIHRINSSSGINYAWKNKPGMYYADAALEALKELNGQVEGCL